MIYRGVDKSLQNPMPLVSVVIPTKNSAGTLEACLRSIRDQTYSNIEVVVVDNFSTDTTQRIVSQCCTARFWRVPGERSEARNLGAKQTRGDYLLFVDSDMELQQTVVEDAVRLVGQGCEAIVIPEVSLGDTFWARVRTLERLTYLGSDDFEASRFLTRALFERIGGYDTQLVAFEDYDLHRRILRCGARIGRTGSIILHHEEDFRLSEHLMKKRYYAGSARRYFSKHPDAARKQFLPLRSVYLTRSHLFIHDPKAAVGVFILKFLESYASLVGLFSQPIDTMTKARIQDLQT
jgi:glycosyltransferase involved in cell wall biosynthesis